MAGWGTWVSARINGEVGHVGECTEERGKGGGVEGLRG
jgi:hypothetical protein